MTMSHGMNDMLAFTILLFEKLFSMFVTALHERGKKTLTFYTYEQMSPNVHLSPMKFPVGH